MSIKALNGNVVLKLVEEESKSAGGIVLTGMRSEVKNQATVIDGGDDKEFEGDAGAILNGDTVIFNTREKLEEVAGLIIVKRDAILAKVI